MLLRDTCQSLRYALASTAAAGRILRMGIVRERRVCARFHERYEFELTMLCLTFDERYDYELTMLCLTLDERYVFKLIMLEFDTSTILPASPNDTV